MTIDQYIQTINNRYKLGNTTEHSFRGDLQNLIESLIPEIRATNEPKRQSCGAPDYIITKKDIPLGFIEAKDIGDADLDGIKKTGNKEQFDRYKASLKDNKVYINNTQYFDAVPQIAWEFYIGGYQPAQKWLKDRKGRKLEYEDILHYQKVIVALSETDRIMKEIDKIEF